MIAETLKAYHHNLSKPMHTIGNLTVYGIQHKQTKTKFYMKILTRPSQQIVRYLNKIKGIGSEIVIKINQFVFQPQSHRLMLIQEPALYGTLKNALNKCKRLEDEDAITISKILLNGHIDLLRGSILWCGDQSDIQFTENGMKLSWNNGVPITENSNPFPDLIQRIGSRPDINILLPFPKNKNLTDLIKVSKQNASQMSLHPLLKKKDKVVKKKGNKWFGIKEFKVKGEYFLELAYLAVSAQFGFVRIKIFDDGFIDEQIIKINQTKPSFVKILDYYKQNNQYIFISQYANDGTVQNYVKRLKNNNIQLKQSQIQFFFFSMIEPLKSLHKLHKSVNMLHIRNVYIEDGIPKIGQPIPLIDSLIQTLIQRADVPDFYHKQFKSSPKDAFNPSFDTYSLGVLLYKLMYTQYPIFPQKHVHIPTTPSYKKNLKNALELFLNTGGTLQQLQQQIEVSDDVKNKVKQNEKLLAEVNKKMKRERLVNSYDNFQNQQVQVQQAKFSELQMSDKSCYLRLWNWLATRGTDRENKYEHLYKSQFGIYRNCVVITIVLLMYILMFFLLYMNGLISLVSHTRLFSKIELSIEGISYFIIAPSYDTFLNQYQLAKNSTNAATGVAVLNQTMNCLIDNKNVYYDFVRADSPHWYIFLILSLITMFALLILKGVLLANFSTVKVGYHYYDTTIQGQNQSKFILSSYVYNQLWWAFALFAFYTTNHYIYHEQHSPCFGAKVWTGMSQSLFVDRFKFAINYLIPIIVVYILCLVSFLQVNVFYKRIKYDILLNPILIYTPFYVALFIMLRVGALFAFSPSFINNANGVIGSSYMDVIGYFPQILVLIQILLCLLIDIIFHRCADPRIERFYLENSLADQFHQYGNEK